MPKPEPSTNAPDTIANTSTNARSLRPPTRAVNQATHCCADYHHWKERERGTELRLRSRALRWPGRRAISIGPPRAEGEGGAKRGCRLMLIDKRKRSPPIPVAVSVTPVMTPAAT